MFGAVVIVWVFGEEIFITRLEEKLEKVCGNGYIGNKKRKNTFIYLPFLKKAFFDCFLLKIKTHLPMK